MPLGGQDIEIILPVLNKTAPFFAHHVSQKVHLRRMPKLKFLVDGSFDHVDKMNSLFNTLSDKENQPLTLNNSDEIELDERLDTISQTSES